MNGVAHIDTHVHMCTRRPVPRACPRGLLSWSPVALYPACSPLLYTVPRPPRSVPCLPWLVLLSPSSGVPKLCPSQRAWVWVWGSCPVQWCTAPRLGVWYPLMMSLWPPELAEQGRRGVFGAEAAERHPSVQRSQPIAGREGREQQEVTWT